MATYKTPKYKVPTYTAPKYDEKTYRKGIDTSFYTNATNQFTQQAEKQRTSQIGEAQRQQQSALKQAYITRAQNQRALNQNLAAAGIRGGATETANLRLANIYGQARASANSDYANSVNSINQNIDQSIFDYTADMQARAEEYTQNQMNARWQAAREDALNAYNAKREDAINAWNAKREDAINKWNAAREDKENKIARKREDEANKYARKQAEVQRQTEYWSNHYMNLYSGYSKKKVKSTLKSIEKKLKKATGYEKIRLEQAKAAAGARLGVITNK